MLKLKGYVFNPITVPQPVLNYALRKLSLDAGGEWRYNNHIERKGRWHYIVSTPFMEGLEEPERFCAPNQDHLFYTDEKGELIMTPIDPDMKFDLDYDNEFFQSTAGLGDWDPCPRNYTSAELYIRDIDYDDNLNPAHQTLSIWLRMRTGDDIGGIFFLGLYSGVLLLRHAGIFEDRRLEVSDFCYARHMLNSLLLNNPRASFAPYYGGHENSSQMPIIHSCRNSGSNEFSFHRIHSIGNIEAINLLHEFAEKGLVDVDIDKPEWDRLLADCPPCPVEYNPEAAGNYNATPDLTSWQNFLNRLGI